MKHMTIHKIWMGLLLSAASCVAHAEAKGVLPTGPAVGDQDISPFYRWSQALPPAPGQLLREEAIPPANTPQHAGKAVRILYTSQDVRWHSGIIPVSGALYLPKGEAPANGWNLIVWAHGTLGVADSCAPSWAGANERDRDYIDRWLEKGYAVVAPDYQGLGGPGPHAYTIWESEGRSILDAARTALHMDSRIANRVVITGQSQGSGASIGAARLVATYAPDINVRGAIATALLPYFEDATQPQDKASPGGSPHILIYRLIGGNLPDGSPPPEHYLTEKGRIVLEAARSGCAARMVAEREGITASDAFSPSPDAVEAAVGPPGQMSPFKVTFPLMLGTGLADEAIPPQRQELAVHAMCRSGNTVIWKRYPGVHHSDTLPASFEDAEAFARNVLNGQSVASDCNGL